MATPQPQGASLMIRTLRNLLTDTKGNTLAIFAAALVLLAVTVVALMSIAGLSIIGMNYAFPVGVVAGLAAGLVAVTLTDRTAAWFGVPWGAYPLTIHSAGWGILFNFVIALGVSKMTGDSSEERARKGKRHAFLQAVSGMTEEQKKKVSLAWGLTLVWFLVGFGPFATIGNTLFSNPSDPETWAPFGLPSLWVWQLMFLAYGIFVMWFLAFQMGLSEPIAPEKVDTVYRERFD